MNKLFSTSSSLIKTIMAIVVFALVFVSFTVFFLNSSFYFAEASVNSFIDFENTDVIDDLESAGINVNDYTSKLHASVEIINFVEFGFSNSP